MDGQGTLSYVYDALGNKLAMRINSQQDSLKVYDYIGNFVYENNMLQYILNDEGRARPVIPDGGTGQTKFVYDYFLKDHLGNVRSVVTAEPVSPKYLAKHEIASANIENLFFDNIPAVRGDKPGSTNPEDTKAALLNASDPNRIIGTTLMLRVMPGDKFTISADAYYDGNDNGKGDNLPAEEIINQLFGTLLQGANYENIPLKELPDNVRTIKEVLGGRGLPEAINDMLDATDDPTLPRAHLNYLVFDDKMNLDTKVSGAVQVPMGGGSWGTLDPGHQIGILTPGYILIYVDNQSIGKDVWFDNIHVEHYTGKVLEQNHYYPFGLTIAQDGAATSTEQPYKYQGIELESHFGLEQYETLNRLLDPQLGRFLQIDPKAELDFSLGPYVSMRNNPAYYTDPFGDVPGEFLDRNGKNIGSDEIEDGKLYVLNTNEKIFAKGTKSEMPGAGSKLSNKDAAKMVASGNINYDEFTEIEGSQDTRQAMMNEVSKDATDNKTEHGGVVAPDGVVIATTPVADNKMDFNTALNPSQQDQLDKITTGFSLFHDHTSAQRDYVFNTSEGQIIEKNNIQIQSPSGTDKDNVTGGAVKGYVFGMGKSQSSRGKGGGGQRVYIYDSRGVRATLPLNKFVKPGK